MTVADDETRFWGTFIALLAHEIGGPSAAIIGLAETQLRGDPDGLLPEDWLELIRDEGERLFEMVKELRQVSRLGDPELLRSAWKSTLNTRQIADQAQAWLAETYAMTVTVSGEGVAVLAEEWVATGFADIVFKIAHRQAGPNVTVDGAEITVGPVPTDDDLRRYVTGDAPESWTAGAAVRVIRALGGSVDLDGETLRLRFPEPHSPEAVR